MRNLILAIFVTLVTCSGFAQEATQKPAYSPNLMKAIKALTVSKFECKYFVPKISMENEFSSLFMYPSKHPVNIPIKKISERIKKEMHDSCVKQNNSEFDINACFRDCRGSFPVTAKNEIFYDQCVTSCKSLYDRRETVVTMLIDLLDAGVVQLDTCEKATSHINNSAKSLVKEKEAGSPKTSKQTSGTLAK